MLVDKSEWNVIIGLHRTNKNTKWSWLDGSNTDFDNWAQNLDPNFGTFAYITDDQQFHWKTMENPINGYVLCERTVKM